MRKITEGIEECRRTVKSCSSIQIKLPLRIQDALIYAGQSQLAVKRTSDREYPSLIDQCLELMKKPGIGIFGGQYAAAVAVIDDLKLARKVLKLRKKSFDLFLVSLFLPDIKGNKTCTNDYKYSSNDRIDHDVILRFGCSRHNCAYNTMKNDQDAPY